MIGLIVWTVFGVLLLCFLALFALFAHKMGRWP